MKIGVCYIPHDDTALTSLLYACANGTVEHLDSFISNFWRKNPSKFIVTDKEGIVWQFSNDLDDLKTCDYRIATFSIETFYTDSSTTKLKEIYNQVDRIFVTHTNGEGTPNLDHHLKLLKYEKVVIILGHTVSYINSHPKIIFDLSLSLFFFYNAFGYYFLNYNKIQDRSNHLIGVYNKDPEYKPSRYQLIESLNKIANNGVHIFQANTPFYTDVSGKVLGKWYWQSMHITSYVDYGTAVANLIFETQEGWQENSIVTEKTLKALLFQKLEIFFIYVGTVQVMDWLHDKGFWFLNSEFYNKEPNVENKFYRESINDKDIPVFRSVYNSVRYLNDLKNQLGSNEKVQKFLIEKYKDKIESNVTRLKFLLENCDYKDRLLGFIQENVYHNIIIGKSEQEINEYLNNKIQEIKEPLDESIVMAECEKIRETFKEVNRL